MSIRKCAWALAVSFAVVALTACAGKPEVKDENAENAMEEYEKDSPESDFVPLQLRWNIRSADVENHPAKDYCVIQITSALMREPVIKASPSKNLEYMVTVTKNGENLEFQGFAGDISVMSRPEYAWTTTCGEGQKVVVKFHNDK